MNLFINKHGKFVIINPKRAETIMEGYCPDCGEHMDDTDYVPLDLPVFHCSECDEDHCEAFHMMPIREWVKMFNEGGG